MDTKFFAYKTGIGFLTISDTSGKISGVTFGRDNVVGTLEETCLIHKTKTQIDEYLKGERNYFDIPLELTGTEFQLKVWNALREIPYGETKSYKEIAQMIGNPQAYRAVGNANNRNPVSIIVPWHRVIGANGDLAGFGGGIEVKKRLLDIEKKSAASI